MNVSEVVRYWLESAEDDWPVVEHLMASGDYHYALYFCPSAYREVAEGIGRRSHRRACSSHPQLLVLAERAGLTLSDERRQQLVRFTGYNLETRYPEDRALLRERYSRQYARAEIVTVREVGSWLKSQLNQKVSPKPPVESE